MIYQIYFLIFFVTLLVTYEMVRLYKKGYRIKFEGKRLRIDNIQKGVRFVKYKLIQSGSQTPKFILNSNKSTYLALKKDFPNFDMDGLQDEYKDYIVDYLKGDKSSNNIVKSKNFTNEIETLSNDKDCDKDSIAVLRTTMNKYSKDDGLAKIQFDTALEYNRNYENGVPRKVQENYISEFVHNYIDLRQTKKIVCPHCKKEVKVNKNAKCPNCDKSYEDDVWYLNRIRKI